MSHTIKVLVRAYIYKKYFGGLYIIILYIVKTPWVDFVALSTFDEFNPMVEVERLSAIWAGHDDGGGRIPYVLPALQDGFGR